jgi:hypothetical protein
VAAASRRGRKRVVAPLELSVEDHLTRASDLV